MRIARSRDSTLSSCWPFGWATEFQSTVLEANHQQKLRTPSRLLNRREHMYVGESNPAPVIPNFSESETDAIASEDEDA